MPDIMTEQEFELQQEAINKDRKLNLNITYPYDPDYEYTTRLERINNDEERVMDLATNKGFIVAPT